jgi:hypothetical protein
MGPVTKLTTSPTMMTVKHPTTLKYKYERRYSTKGSSDSDGVPPLQDRIITLYAHTTPWGRVLFEKLTVIQMAKKFAAFYRTQKFITVFPRTRHWSLS